jgi:hypothetical protein
MTFFLLVAIVALIIWEDVKLQKLKDKLADERVEREMRNDPTFSAYFQPPQQQPHSRA